MHFSFIDSKNNEIYVYKWSPNEKIKMKGIVQIVHGSMEHSGRYKHVAEYLTHNGYIVYANDHPGHGKSLKNGAILGDIKQYGTLGVLENIEKLTTIVQKENPNMPIFILSHSWGSMLVKALIEKNNYNFNGALFTGVIDSVFNYYITKFLLKSKIKKEGLDKSCSLWDFQMNKLLKKAIKNPKTKWDWLTRDSEKIHEYINDKMCAFIPPNSFMAEFLELYKNAWKYENEGMIPKNLPIYFFVGSNDDGNSEKRIKNIIKRYSKHGIIDITYKIYENARHEPLNEINRMIVLKDIVKWLDIHRS